jgi:hypothetical protein
MRISGSLVMTNEDAVNPAIRREGSRDPSNKKLWFQRVQLMRIRISETSTLRNEGFTVPSITE